MLRLLAMAGLVAGTLVITSQASGSGCPSGSWPPITHAPAAVPSADVRLYFAHGRWQLRLHPGAGQSLATSVTADSRLAALRSSPGVRAVLRRTARTVSFTLRAGSSGQSLSFATRCARRVAFAFSDARIVIGRRSAPLPTFALERPATAGIAGRLIAGPTCPVVGPGANCPPARPVQGTVQIQTVPASRASSGPSTVTTVSSDAGGRFSASLPPGQYQITAHASSGMTYGSGTSRTMAVTVAGGVISDVVLAFDTGIR